MLAAEGACVEIADTDEAEAAFSAVALAFGGVVMPERVAAAFLR
jgi:hypothetical protein